MPIRFGIVGCGMIARFHARAIAEVKGTKLAGCASKTTASAEKFASEFPCRVFRSWQELVASSDIDAVVVCTPSGAHLPPAVAAARAGKHVIVEKPLEITTRRCDRIIDECRRAGVLLATVFPSRFQTCWQPVRKALTAGRFGRLTLISGYVKWYRSQAYYDSGNWRGTWKLDGGGALMNQAIHTVDLLLWLGGPVVSAKAHRALLAHTGIEVEDVLTATVQYANGALGVIEATTAAYPGQPRRIEICGDRGTVVVEDETIRIWQFDSKSPSDRDVLKEFGRPVTAGGATDPKSISHINHARQLRDFVSAIRNNRPPLIDGAEGRRSIHLIESLY